jgi:hypothetical protein
MPPSIDYLCPGDLKKGQKLILHAEGADLLTKEYPGIFSEGQELVYVGFGNLDRKDYGEVWLQTPDGERGLLVRRNLDLFSGTSEAITPGTERRG